MWRKDLLSEVSYQFTLALPKGKTYFGEVEVNFTLKKNLTEKDDTLFLDFVGNNVSNLVVND